MSRVRVKLTTFRSFTNLHVHSTVVNNHSTIEIKSPASGYLSEYSWGFFLLNCTFIFHEDFIYPFYLSWCDRALGSWLKTSFLIFNYFMQLQHVWERAQASLTLMHKFSRIYFCFSFIIYPCYRIMLKIPLFPLPQPFQFAKHFPSRPKNWEIVRELA